MCHIQIHLLSLHVRSLNLVPNPPTNPANCWLSLRPSTADLLEHHGGGNVSLRWMCQESLTKLSCGRSQCAKHRQNMFEDVSQNTGDGGGVGVVTVVAVVVPVAAVVAVVVLSSARCLRDF